MCVGFSIPWASRVRRRSRSSTSGVLDRLSVWRDTAGTWSPASTQPPAISPSPSPSMSRQGSAQIQVSYQDYWVLSSSPLILKYWTIPKKKNPNIWHLNKRFTQLQFNLSNISTLPVQWSWGGACTLNSSPPGNHWSHLRCCRTNRRSRFGPGRSTWMWIPSAGICLLKSCPPTRPWHPICLTLQGPTALASDWSSCWNAISKRGTLIFLSSWEMLQMSTLQEQSSFFSVVIYIVYDNQCWICKECSLFHICFQRHFNFKGILGCCTFLHLFYSLYSLVHPLIKRRLFLTQNIFTF